ncbi:gamma-glutamyl-gamma-aminobutyrate hydrolase [Azomonas agilis]|uniref:gamma-glutamyl-gamma-aminobutyrate hydrolase n=1 Tax=Azomonas agilis TaxID=116849 RepID=A0A562I1M7_9GAMM|nr:gamma-glutamyl-gamma-aminobutyrate hydrolase family protein [Azomonas agilis]TWH64604.1 gamma-glutamyl-gamma-aminobutyrate hydrolase [Azomonas agilis]
MSHLPLIGVSACTSLVGKHLFHIAGDKYLQAAALAGWPVIIPALGTHLEVEDLLAHLDAVLFTGSPSNVDPSHYQGAQPGVGPHDPARDHTSLALIRAAVALGVPILGICRGFQEMNVAFGGSLHQKVHEAGPYQDHREEPDETLEVQYGPSHEVQIEPGGLLERIGLPEQIRVNSLHGQGVDRLGAGLRVEARAPDALIEAFSLDRADRFALGVQWHPEWQVQSNPHYQVIFQAFARAAQRRVEQRRIATGSRI